MRDTEKKGTAGKSSGAEFLQMQGDRPYRSQGKPGQSAAALSQQRQGKDRQHEGVIILKILYIIGNDEMPFYSMETMLPFTHVIEAKGITKDSVYFLQADLEQLSTTMADGDEIEVKAAVGLNVLVLRQWEEQLIDQVEEKPLDMKKIEAMPGITV